MDEPWLPRLYNPNIDVLTLLIQMLSSIEWPINFKKISFSSPDTTKKISHKELRHFIAYWAHTRGLSKAGTLSNTHLVIVLIDRDIKMLKRNTTLKQTRCTTAMWLYFLFSIFYFTFLNLHLYNATCNYDKDVVGIHDFIWLSYVDQLSIQLNQVTTSQHLSVWTESPHNNNNKFNQQSTHCLWASSMPKSSKQEGKDHEEPVLPAISLKIFCLLLPNQNPSQHIFPVILGNDWTIGDLKDATKQDNSKTSMPRSSPFTWCSFLMMTIWIASWAKWTSIPLNC